LLGGASLVVWAGMTAAQTMRDRASVDEGLVQLGLAALSLSLVANYPHFLASYRLAYTRGRTFVRTHWWQLVVVPLLLATALVSAYASYETPVAELPWAAGARDALAPFGLNAQVVSGPRLGDLVLALGFNVMILTIGWHYTKQVFGCLMVYARYDGYPFSASQRTLTRRALLAMWALAFVDNNREGAWRAFNVFSYSSLDLPDVVAGVALVAALGGAALLAVQVFVANYRAGGHLPSPTMVVPLVALYVWWLPMTRQDEFYFVMAPLFHSVQYLAFVWKVEAAKLRRAARGAATAVAGAATVGLGLVGIGWMSFEGVPHAIDSWAGTSERLGLPFFFVAATLFLNIHHYFIDNVIWRFADPEVRANLLEEK
jgi:hypothetical protein